MANQVNGFLSGFSLERFSADFALQVASWVLTPEALFWLAPATPSPLTADKVLAWVTPRDNPYLFWKRGIENPVGYAELNPMPRHTGEYWIGHVIVPESLRGQGIGYALTRHLLQRAFEHFHAVRVSLIVFPENRTALRCYLKAGLLADGVQHKTFDHLEGEFRLLKMTITAKQYEKNTERKSE